MHEKLRLKNMTHVISVTKYLRWRRVSGNPSHNIVTNVSIRVNCKKEREKRGSLHPRKYYDIKGVRYCHIWSITFRTNDQIHWLVVAYIAEECINCVCVCVCVCVSCHCEPLGQNVSIVSQICLILVSNCLKRSQFYLNMSRTKCLNLSQFETFLTFETQLRLPPFESNYSALSKWCQKGLKNVSNRDLGGFSGWTVFSGT